jgi:transposase InsO family protein
MVLRRMVVDAVVVEGRSVREVASAFGRSKSWVHDLVTRYRAEGDAALEERSRRPVHSPRRTSDDVEEAIVRLRKDLCDLGADAGPQTIAWHLERQRGSSPSPATIYRILARRGFITPEPRKRPTSSFIRFEADQPNERWQGDVTHWALEDGSDVEILNFIDDHSRLVLVADVRRVTKGPDVLATYAKACQRWGEPASVLTDNGAVFNGTSRGGITAFEVALGRAGVVYKHSRPYHPQTCGKVERWHQTLKGFLAKRPPARTIVGLQGQVDEIVEYYNEQRPHRARGRLTPAAAFAARDKAVPGMPGVDPHYRIRHDKVDGAGKISLRFGNKMLHLGVGRPWKGTRVRLYIAGDEIRVVSEDGELIAATTIDLAKGYQKMRKPPAS